jgi:hypothetical protein
MFFSTVAHRWSIIDSKVAHPAASKSADSTDSSAHQSPMGAAQSNLAVVLIYEYWD